VGQAPQARQQGIMQELADVLGRALMGCSCNIGLLWPTSTLLQHCTVHLGSLWAGL